MTTFKAQLRSADAPNLEAGVYDADFEGAAAESHPDWAGKSQFGEDDGERFRFDFTTYVDGDPIRINLLTNQNLNPNSKTVPKAVQVLKALMTAAEFAAWKTGEEELDATKLIGRRCQLELETKENGWPKVLSVIKASKGGK